MHINPVIDIVPENILLRYTIQLISLSIFVTEKKHFAKRIIIKRTRKIKYIQFFFSTIRSYYFVK